MQTRAAPWKPRAVKRVYVPKRNGKQRPIGIPVIADRCLQALTLNALEPEWEARYEPRVYGFRPGRGCHDAIVAIHTTASGKNAQRLWALDADLEAAFGGLDHHHLLQSLGTFPARAMIAGWLKAGVVENGWFTPTEQGSPQGGVISPALLNIALHGMGKAAGVRYTTCGSNAATVARNSPAMVVYADDLLALCHSREQAEQVKARLAAWLAIRGLRFNEDKTRIVHLDEGVNFLGVRDTPVPRQAADQTEHGGITANPAKAHYRNVGPAWVQRSGSDHQAQPGHRGLGRLLPDWCVQKGVRLAG
jgi:RNA-directed DNA polymerase